MKAPCPYCGEEKDSRHIALCPKNPNKRIISKKKEPLKHKDTVILKSKIKDDGWLKRAWRSVFPKKQKPQIQEVESPDLLITGKPLTEDEFKDKLKPYEIPQTNPKTGIGKLLHKGKDFIQVVLVSEFIEPKTFWAEKTGLRVIKYQDRMYKLPRDIKGNVFFWHIDKKEPLVDSAHATEQDAEDSFHELQVFNMGYALGRLAGANELMSKIGIILMLVIIVGILQIANLGYIHQVEGEINTHANNIANTLNIINQSTYKRILIP